jgi:hypothetical protein
MKVKIERQCWLGDKSAMVGEVHEVSRVLGRQLIGSNAAIQAPEAAPKAEKKKAVK